MEKGTRIMDMSSDDGDCQVEAVVTPISKATKQARLPFQTISSDSPTVNKKRKKVVSPGRNAKVPKVTKNEKSVETSKKNEVEEITIDDENDAKNSEKKIEKNENSKDNSKQSTETPDSKNKKTPGRNKAKKLDSRVQLTPLTKFFKKVDDKDNKVSKNETQTSTPKSEESKAKNSENNNKETTKKSQEHGHQKEEEEEVEEKEKAEVEVEVEVEKKEKKSSSKNRTATETFQKLNCSSLQSKENKASDVDSKNSTTSDEDDSVEADESNLNETEKMDEDSDINLVDDSMSDTDGKKTEHEDTDNSKDGIIKSKNSFSTPVRKKLLNSSKSKKLTPKQMAKKLENQKKREEREKKLQEERESRKREKEEKKRERDEKEKALKEQKRIEKEQKELKRQAELELKQKEKEAKEEDRRKREEAKEEEKRKKEEERLEAERKKQKASSTFKNFFVSKKTIETKPVEEEAKIETKNFMPFEVKADMRIAPVLRRNLTNEEKLHLDKLVLECSAKKSELYINEIKNKKYKVRKSEKTWPFEANDDIVILEDESSENSNVVQAGNDSVKKHRAKLLMFNENRRPPYWGTWRKKSETINPRRPFAVDKKWFDYEVDSDDEWEEEEPGESLRGSDDEKEEDPEDNEYDVDNDFMVPHGYLSEEELMADEEEGEEEDDLNPEKQKTKLKILNEQFEAERKQKTTKLQPKVIGCIWLNSDNTYPENTPSYAIRLLTARQAWTREMPLVLTAPADGEFNSECSTPKHNTSNALKERNLEDAMPDIIRLLHGNTNGRNFLVKEFLEYWTKRFEEPRPLPKIRLKQRIGEVAKWGPCPEPGPMHEKLCWYVAEEYRTKYLPDETLTLPNRWTYSLTPKKRNSMIAEAIEKAVEEKERDKEKKPLSLITQFTKALTAEEMQKQLAEKSTTPKNSKDSGIATPNTAEKPASSTPVLNTTPQSGRPPKRVALVSLPRKECFSKSPRVSLIDIFVTKEPNSENEKERKKKPCKTKEDDDCMVVCETNEFNSENEKERKKKPCKTKEDDDCMVVCETNEFNSENEKEKEIKPLETKEDDCIVVDTSEEINVTSFSSESDGGKTATVLKVNSSDISDSAKSEETSDKIGNSSKSSDVEVVEV